MVHIRWMEPHEVPEVLQFAVGWSKKGILKRRNKTIRLVAELNSQIVGFMIYELKPTLLRVLDLIVHEDWRRRGVGAELIAKVKTKLMYDRSRIVIFVGETELQAQLFLQKQSFKAVRVLESPDKVYYIMEYTK